MRNVKGLPVTIFIRTQQRKLLIDKLEFDNPMKIIATLALLMICDSVPATFARSLSERKFMGLCRRDRKENYQTKKYDRAGQFFHELAWIIKDSVHYYAKPNGKNAFSKNLKKHMTSVTCAGTHDGTEIMANDFLKTDL